METAFSILDHLQFDCLYQKKKDVLWTTPTAYFYKIT